MIHPTTSAFTPRHHIERLRPRIGIPNEPAMTEETLPFTVRLVRNQDDLNKAVQIRHSAYARHMPAVAETLRSPERIDTEDGVVVLLAESKLDGSPLGTARIQTNQFQRLGLEESVEFPDWLKGQTLAHISRLGIIQGTGGRLVKFMLFKGLFKYWEQNGIEWAVVAARAPLDRMYQQLLFEDVFPGQGFTPLAHMNNIPHRVMAFEVGTARERWTLANHPLTDFICHTDHPDLDVSHMDPAAYAPMTVQNQQMRFHATL
ncbi:hypothetical protein [Rhodoferax sp.]|uniref:hypothetical protein n=1 Tax=Rhodoferax sp. TaxID=50421 RepID=UPI00275974D9|nr:hypothetical protein [Rhodoferax sp.]